MGPLISRLQLPNRGFSLEQIRAMGRRSSRSPARTTCYAGTSEEIGQLERQFNAAYASNDLKSYFGFYAADAILWFIDKRTSVPEYEASWTKYANEGNRIKTAQISDYHPRLGPSGDVAIVGYRLHLVTQLQDGSELNEKCFETDIWTQMHGKWKVTNVHFSEAEPPVTTTPLR